MKITAKETCPDVIITTICDRRSFQ